MLKAFISNYLYSIPIYICYTINIYYNRFFIEVHIFNKRLASKLSHFFAVKGYKYNIKVKLISYKLFDNFKQCRYTTCIVQCAWIICFPITTDMVKMSTDYRERD